MGNGNIVQLWSKLPYAAASTLTLALFFTSDADKLQIALLASLRPGRCVSRVFWALRDNSHLCSFCFPPSVTAHQRTAGPPWGLLAIRLCHLCLGASRGNIWPLPWRRWSTSGRSTVNTSLPLFPDSALYLPLENCLCLSLKIDSQSTSHQPLVHVSPAADAMWLSGCVFVGSVIQYWVDIWLSLKPTNIETQKQPASTTTYSKPSWNVMLSRLK